MSLSSAVLFLMEESSDSSDSDLDELLDDDMEHMVVLLAAKELADGLKKRRRGSKVGRLCILGNRNLVNNMLMCAYFDEVPTYSAHLFRRQYRMRRSLFNKIVKTCETDTRYLKRKRNAAG